MMKSHDMKMDNMKSEKMKSDKMKSDKMKAKIEALIKQRNEARAAKDWAAADAARNELTAMGIVLEDGPNGTTWRKQ
jgi:cysteinyl-tRNA synthetase